MPPLSLALRRKRAAGVKAVLLDIDGVLTDGLVYHMVDSGGLLIEFKGINAQDSIGLAWLAESGLITGAISGRNSQGMQERLKMLHVTHIYQGRLDKRFVFDEICRLAKVSPSQTLYIGDDLPDIPVLGAAGLAVAPANARPEVKARAHWVTKARAGEGAVREVAELVLQAQGRWQAVLDKFSGESPEAARASAQ